MTPLAPVIETARLVLRAPQLSDHAALCRYFAEPRSAFNGGTLEPHQVGSMILAGAGCWALRGYGIWHFMLKGQDKVAGFAGIFHPIDWPEPELGYGIAAEHEGKGLAFEAAQAARQAAARHFGLTRLVSYVAHDNLRSQALARRLGAVQEAEVTLRGKPAQAWRHPEGVA